MNEWQPVKRGEQEHPGVDERLSAYYGPALFEARFPRTSSMLACAYKPRLRPPQVRVMLLAKRKIRLKLPIDPAALEPAELDVLLATGLARYLHMRRPAYAIKRFLGYSLLLLVWAVVVWWFWHPLMPRFVLPIAIMLCIALYAVVLWQLHKQARRMALQADTLMVLWLGRGHVCRGLHALEKRSRNSSRRRWGELSLAERIAHVCGTEAPMQHERLTLVR